MFCRTTTATAAVSRWSPDLGEVWRYGGSYSFGGKVGRDNMRYPTQLKGGGVTSLESELILVEEIAIGYMVGDFIKD